MRVPWSMLAIGDPSSHTGIQPVKGKAKAVNVRNIALLVDAGAGGTASGVVTWDGWQKANYTERVKTGVQPLVDAWAALSAPTR